jgi:hypothetical protein
VKRYDLLRSQALLVSIAVLVLNDFVLKAAFHNWLTGKLSDFAGLTAVTLFSCAIWPKHIRLIGVTITAAFSYWKSPYSQGVIDALNVVLPFWVGRTVDYTDLMALPVVWLVCGFAPKFTLWKMKQLQVFAIAATSLVAFTGTSVVNQYAVRENAEISRPGDSNIGAGKTEAELQSLFDGVAERNHMQCRVCEPLSKGRSYAGIESARSSLFLTANFDAGNSLVFYDVQTHTPKGAQGNAAEVDSIRQEVRAKLVAAFPSIRILALTYPPVKWVSVGVWKTDPDTSYRQPKNQDDYGKVLAIMAEIAGREGLTKESDTRYYAGRLYGPAPYDHDLYVALRVADSPLVDISISCHSAECLGRQRALAKKIEHRLQEALGSDRASIRQLWAK